MKENTKFEIEGDVTVALPNAQFKVMLEPPMEKEITCRICGKIRYNNITISVGDHVRVELSGYDLTKGRIMRRL